MIDRSRLGVAGVAGGVIMALLTLVFLLTPRAHSFNVAPQGSYAVYADAGGLPLGILSGANVTDPNSGPSDTAATPEPGETLPAERHDLAGNLSIQELSIQKRFNMSNAPGGGGLGNWTLVIRADDSVANGTISNIALDVTGQGGGAHWCVLNLFAAIIGAEVANMTADSVTLNTVYIRMRQGGYFTPVIDPPNDPPCAAPPV